MSCARPGASSDGSWMPVGVGAARATARLPRRAAEGDPFRRSADVIGPICQRLERFAKDGVAFRRNPPDSKCAADVRTHAFAERQHMPPVRQGLKRGSVARPSPVRIALERDLTLGVCGCLAQESELFCHHRSTPNEGQLLGNVPSEKRSRPEGRPKSREETPKEGCNIGTQ